MQAAAAAAVLLQLPEVSQVVKAGTLLIKSLTRKDKATTVNAFHSELAPCYGTLKGSLKAMDDNLQIVIAGTTNKLGKLVQEAQAAKKLIPWEDIVAAMTQNTLLEPMDDVINRSDKLIKNDSNYFKFDGSPSAAVVKEVHSWFVRLLADEDVLKDTKIDIDAMGALVAQTGAAVEDFETLIFKRVVHTAEVLDIGVLRYPDLDHPYFKLYRIQLTAWSDCTRILFVQDDCNGITGEYTCRKYKPRASVLAGISEPIRKKAIQEAEDLFA